MKFVCFEISNHFLLLASKMPVVNDKEREAIAQENVKKLHRMVLGEDKNINNDYVENFYVDMAKGVRKILIS